MMYKPSIASLVKRDGHKCHYCELDMLTNPDTVTREHVVPRSFGGTWKMHNIVLACRSCNEKRGNEYFYCGCDFCLKAYELNVYDQFESLINYNHSNIRKTKKGQWSLNWRGKLFFYPSFKVAVESLINRETDFWTKIKENV